MSLGAFEMVAGVAFMVTGIVGLVVTFRLNELGREISLIKYPFMGDDDDSAKFYADEQK